MEARDYYVPNPSCKEFQKYEWIGQLMGAALRGKDFMVSNGAALRGVNLVSLFSAELNLFKLVLYFNLAGFGIAWSSVEAAHRRKCELG